MSNSNAEPVHGPAPSEEAAATTSTEGTKSPSGTPSGNYTTATKISSLGDLKEKAPEVYDAMMQGIMINFIGDQQRRIAHLKEMNREARQNS